MNRRVTNRHFLCTLSVAGIAALAGLWLAPDARAEGDKGPMATVEGTVTDVQGSCPNLRFKLGETQVMTKEQTKYEDGSCKDIQNNKKIEVKGQRDQKGMLTAAEIDLQKD